jgi:AcrR family transcriptional regulator
MPTHQERTQATRRALIDAGRRLFAEHGYGGVGVGEIAQAAGVTTGAIYHQFGSKEGLFVAVYDELVQATWTRIQTAREANDHPNLVSDCEAYLDACADPAFFRITADGPAVLGWDYLVAQTSGLIAIGLTDARDRGEIVDVPIEPLSRMLAAALKEAGVIIATASDAVAARNQASVTARHLIGGLLRNKPVTGT